MAWCLLISGIGDEGAQQLCCGLEATRSLRRLWIDRNEISLIGASAVCAYDTCMRVLCHRRLLSCPCLVLIGVVRLAPCLQVLGHALACTERKHGDKDVSGLENIPSGPCHELKHQLNLDENLLTSSECAELHGVVEAHPMSSCFHLLLRASAEDAVPRFGFRAILDDSYAGVVHGTSHDRSPAEVQHSHLVGMEAEIARMTAGHAHDGAQSELQNPPEPPPPDVTIESGAIR